MTPSNDFMVNYREGGSVLRIANDRVLPVEGIGKLTMSFWSCSDWAKVILPDVVHVPKLGYKFLSFNMMADHGHKYVGEKKGVTLHPKNGLFFIHR